MPGDPEMTYHLALLEHNAGNLDRAAELYQSIGAGPVAGAYTSFDRGLLTFKRYHQLGLVELGRGNYEAAKAWLLSALRDQPRELASAFVLFDAELKQNDGATAEVVHERVQRIEGYSDNWIGMLVRIMPEPEIALRGLLKTAPSTSAARMELALILLNSGRQQEAAPHLTLLADAGTAEAAYFLGVVAADAENLVEARGRLSQAHKLNPNHSETKARLAILQQE